MKKILVNLFITNKKISNLKNIRTISLGENISFNDKQNGLSKSDIIIKGQIFYAIHMASQGYWQIQDEEK